MRIAGEDDKGAPHLTEPQLLAGLKRWRSSVAIVSTGIEVKAAQSVPAAIRIH
jgi:hypothetical protein